MKCTVGALAVLLLVTTMSLGQESAFPYAANPSPYTNSPLTIEIHRNLPASMAAREDMAPYVVISRPDFDVPPSPFPYAASPSPLTNKIRVSLGNVHSPESPFPYAANPSNQ
jgi:hypothetical protein